MSQNILVIFGGRSNENEISVITGCMVSNVLKNAGENVVPVFISQDGKFFTGEKLTQLEAFKAGGFSKSDGAAIANGGVYSLNKKGKIKAFTPVYAAINCCHGGLGEGGGVSGLVSLAGIPLASAGLFESAAFMDKYYTKLVLNSLSVKCAPYVHIRRGEIFDDGEIEYPVIVKPCKLGSSIGIARADDKAQLKEALDAAFMYDDGVICEKFFADKREINCAAYLGDYTVVSECEEVFAGDIYSYDDKYSGGAKNKIPADIPAETARKIQDITRKIYDRLNMRGVIRIDYILSGGEVYLSEINTVPGSLSYYLLSSGLKNFYPVLKALIKRAREDFAAEQKKLVLNTGILNNFSLNACKINKK